MKLTRKKLIFLLIICLILCLIFMYRDSHYMDENLGKAVQTSGTPVSSHTVILDAGHGEPDRRGGVK
ncbi:MAG: hypothetical protein IJ867_01560 [Clostridia bacterium]|nr:hypothetical protein [Clostridia bacterium]